MTATSQERKFCPRCGLETDAGEAMCPRDGQALKHILDREPAFAGKYEVEGVIGAGGMGLIYKARQLALNKLVAIKMMHAHLMSEDAVRRFQIEGKAVGLLSHPFIVGVHDLGTTSGGQPFMVMDFVEGKTLAQVMTRDGQIARARFLRIFIQVCEALMHAHKRGVLHRDLKPSNIMLVRGDDMSEEVRIMDFGIAKLVSDTESGAQQLTKTGEAIGSPIYMSPEQARGMKTDARADLYSLGCVMYETITGTPPFVGNTPLDTMLMHLNEDPLPLREASLGQDVDPLVEEVVMKLLEKDPNDRFQSMGETLNELSAIQSNRATSKRNKAGAAQAAAAETNNTKVIIAAVAAVVVVLTGVGGFIAYRAFHKTPNASHGNSQTAASSSATKHIETNFEPMPNDTPRNMIASLVRNRDARISMEDLRAAFKLETLTRHDMEPFDTPEAAVFIKILNLSECNITDNALEPIQNLKLQSLNLISNPLKDLHALKKMTTLRELQLAKTDLNKAAFQVISNLKSLDNLNLSSTPISDQDLPYLYGLNKLVSLKLQNCPNLTKQALDQLQEKLPDCQIGNRHIVREPRAQSNEQMFLRNIRDNYMHKQQWAKAEAELQKFERQLRARNDEEDTEPWRLARRYLAETYFKRAVCLVHLKAKAQAEELRENAFRIWMGDPKSINMRRAEFAQHLEAEGDVKSAIPLRAEVREYWERHQGEMGARSIEDVTPYMANSIALGVDFARDGDDASAGPVLGDALSFLDQNHLDKSALASNCAVLLGDTYMRRRMWRQAERSYQRSFDIDRNNPELSKTDNFNNLVFKLGQCACENKDYELAERMFRFNLNRPAPPVQRAIQYRYLIRVAESQNHPQDVQKYSGELAKLSTNKQ